MKTKDSLSELNIEHRGFDKEVTENFNLEMQVVKKYNQPRQKVQKEKIQPKESFK